MFTSKIGSFDTFCRVVCPKKNKYWLHHAVLITQLEVCAFFYHVLSIFIRCSNFVDSRKDFLNTESLGIFFRESADICHWSLIISPHNYLNLCISTSLYFTLQLDSVVYVAWHKVYADRSGWWGNTPSNWTHPAICWHWMASE